MMPWRQASFGGGGYITGIAVDPFRPDRIYARCDVGGAFVSADAGRSWQPRNAGLSAPHTHMVAALIPSPDRPDVVLRCSGDARDGRTYGTIHLSTDAGASWRLVNDQVDFYGNGPTRMFGEVCSFDPHTRGRVLVGGYSRGVWISDNGGLDWRAVGLHGERIAAVRHHPTVPGLVYAGTVGDSALDGLWAMGNGRLVDLVLEHGDLPRGSVGTLYRSTDGGESWSAVQRRNDWGINGIEVSPDDPNLVVLATSDGISVCAGRGAELVAATGLVATSYSFVRRDPHRVGRYLTAPHSGGDQIPLSESTDGGRTWQLLRERHEQSDLVDYPAYIDSPAAIGGGISDIAFDATRPDRFYMTGYFGVSRTDDGGATFSGHGFEGVETLCAESVVTDPATYRVYVTLCDHTPAMSEDGGRTYRPFGQSPAPTSALAVSPHDPDIVLWGAGRKRQFHRDAYLIRSCDGGRTSEVVRVFTGRRFVQALTADPRQRGRFYAFVDGEIEPDDVDSAGLYRSDDFGSTWTQLPTPFPECLDRLPVETDWVESEVLPCVVYQKRNGNGANQLLLADPRCTDRVYVGEWSLGPFRSDDAGMTWRSIAAGLPIGQHRLGLLSHLYGDPEREDWLYAGFVADGLWRSIDGGETWSQLLGSGEQLNATSVATHGHRIAVASEPMYWTRTPPRILLSDDLGASWRDIHPVEAGAVRWKGIAFDADGRLHAISCGNGIFHADPGEGAADPGADAEFDPRSGRH